MADQRISELDPLTNPQGSDEVGIRRGSSNYRVTYTNSEKAIILTGSGAPSSTPAFQGQRYYDTAGDKLYAAMGAGSGDWKLIPAGDVGNMAAFFDGGGSALADGSNYWVQAPFAGTIVRATLLADVSGSVTVTAATATFAAAPTFGDIGTVALSSAQKEDNSGLAGWTTALAAQSFMRFTLSGVATITKLNVNILIEKT